MPIGILLTKLSNNNLKNFKSALIKNSDGTIGHHKRLGGRTGPGYSRLHFNLKDKVLSCYNDISFISDMSYQLALYLHMVGPN